MRRNCLIKDVIERKIEGRVEMRGKSGRRGKQLPNDVKVKGGYRNLKDEELEHTLWRIRFGRGYGPVVRQTTD